MAANNPLMPKVRAVARGLNELGVVGFVRKVVAVLFLFSEHAKGEILF